MSQGSINGDDITRQLREWARELGFSQIGVADVDLSSAEAGLRAWLEAGFHGDMDYMARHGMLRARPAELVPGTVRVITARMDYLPEQEQRQDWRSLSWDSLASPANGHVSLYARGRDYHKVLRQRLQVLAQKLEGLIGPYGYRVFTDSAPVMEVELASRSGLGWRGKHTLTLSREAGSMFFLGEIFVDMALPLSESVTPHCGQCRSCLSVCPTGAIVAPFQVDARRCISYLTIEHSSAIPVEWRPAMGNRIYGCDDCQLICPWNKFAQPTKVVDFQARPGMTAPALTDLWAWDEPQFLRRMEGSAIRRIGHERWLRNLAVAMGNALAAGVPEAERIRGALVQRRSSVSALVGEHIDWALAQGGSQTDSGRSGEVIPGGQSQGKARHAQQG